MGDVLKELRALAWSVDYATFCMALQEFLDTHAHLPAFVTYFKSTWTERTSTAEWALFARGKGVPTGDQQMESYHRRLKETVLNHELNLPIDRLFKALNGDWVYISAILGNDQLRAAHLREAEHQRTRYALSAYHPKNIRHVPPPAAP